MRKLVKSRRWVADVLVRVAYRLDPQRPTVTTARHGGHTIAFGRTPLARVRFVDGKETPDVSDERPIFKFGSARWPDTRSRDGDFSRDLDEPETDPLP